jgi:hypothetical protein
MSEKLTCGSSSKSTLYLRWRRSEPSGPGLYCPEIFGQILAQVGSDSHGFSQTSVITITTFSSSVPQERPDPL